MAQIWNVSDYSNILPGYQAGLKEWALRQANERAKLQEERLQRLEELRQSYQHARESRLADQYGQMLEQQKAVQARLATKDKQNLDIERAYALGFSGLPATPDLDPYGMAEWNRGKADRELKSPKPLPQVQIMRDPITGIPIGYSFGNTGRFTTPAIGRRTERDLMGNVVTTTPERAVNPWTGEDIWYRPPGSASATGATNAPVSVPRYEIDQATGRPRRVR